MTWNQWILHVWRTEPSRICTREEALAWFREQVKPEAHQPTHKPHQRQAGHADERQGKL